MVEHKYTKDGKKVAILNKLNSQEYIVQEIFVVEGNEVPAGENFVAKGLLDAPGVSWKEKNIKDIESRLERLQESVKRKEKDLYHKRDVVLKGMEEKLKAIEKTIDPICTESFDMISKFLKDEYKYVVEKESWIWRIKEFTDRTLYYTDRHYNRLEFDGIHLLSLMGNSNGDLYFNIHKYSTGGDTKEVYFFTTLEEARIKFKELNEEKCKDGYRMDVIEEYLKWDIPLDQTKYSEYLEKQRASKEKRIKEINKKMDEEKEEIAKLMKEINNDE